ncbi:ferric reductase like transmembrane component-domain-containing protein [Penicillium argentinense]|uniref:Ferric reductase like transmembrane component-domain-containing protein n=1 Tax=Penicillium argentinense TaxID=1131581 RepID=A0A9W9EJ15_9EURO|nr:ferric reductase like transmembrane component-domain-containing protein [Penicillium argentinense]KAJ5082731.1 ferric reductase like transmembrane component-domain-containing protein [Penicillium argentinense]
MYASLYAWCSETSLKAAVPYWESLYEQNILTLMGLASIKERITDEYIATLDTIDPESNSHSCLRYRQG